MRRFAFGKNWENFATKVTPERLALASSSLSKLIKQNEIRNATVLDVGSGSGIHAASFLNLGASHVTAIDYDQNSVRATQRLLENYDNARYKVYQADILELSTMPSTKFDIVYSWGVLHHTGDMVTAIKNTCSFVKPGGILVIALYRKTPLCGFWRMEKRFYSRAPKFLQALILRMYTFVFTVALFARSHQSLASYKKSYKLRRGMDLEIDFHDWLGGFPYESISPSEYVSLLETDFIPIRTFVQRAGFGILGSGCDEFVHKRVSV